MFVSLIWFIIYSFLASLINNQCKKCTSFSLVLGNSLLRWDALWEVNPSVAAMVVLTNSQIGMEQRNEDLEYGCILSISPLT